MATGAQPKKPANGYGNIYTPHAGPMIIQVQRESGLASRTIILSQKYIRWLRIINSKRGLLIGIAFMVSWVGLAVQAARVPMLTSRIATLEHENQRIDTLAAALSTLHKRYDQVQRMLGVTAAPMPATAAATAAATPAAATRSAATSAADSVQPARSSSAAAAPSAVADSGR
jgi:hypothetical protein